MLPAPFSGEKRDTNCTQLIHKYIIENMSLLLMKAIPDKQTNLFHVQI